MAIGLIGPLPSQRCTWTPTTPTNPAGKAALPTSHAEFLAFLRLVAKPTRGGSCMWCSTTTAPTPIHGQGLARQASARPPALHPDFGSWMNLVEMFVSIITRQAIRRVSFAGVGDLVAAIRRFVDGWNQRRQPFVWVKTPATS
jgi:hypothetical protein